MGMINLLRRAYNRMLNGKYYEAYYLSFCGLQTFLEVSCCKSGKLASFF